MHVKSEIYLTHKIFGELNDLIEFYEFLSTSTFSFGSAGTSAVFNFESYIFSSIQGTLSSIRLILKDGRINDAFALLRKYHDSVIIQIYAMTFLEENCSLENLIVEKIDNWLKNKEELPRFSEMKQYIFKSNRLADINSLLNKDDRYERIRKRCNSHMHYNYFHNLIVNDNEIHIDNRLNLLNIMMDALSNIFIMHFVCVFTIAPHYMVASDYIDHLDCGMQPPEDSQYWVANFVQNIFDRLVKTNRPDLAEILKSSTCMKLQ